MFSLGCQQLQTLVNSIHSLIVGCKQKMNYRGAPGGGHYALLVDLEVTIHPAQKPTVQEMHT